MSINTAHANGGVLIYNGEFILLYCDGVELTIEGGDAKEFGGTKKGRIYLTSHRMIFTNKSEKDNLQSMSFPFFSLSKVELEQPVFGANYIKGIVHAQPNGYWIGKAVFKLKFFSGGAIEFGQAMLKSAKMMSAYLPPQPPPYVPHNGPYFPAPPPSYTAPPGGINGWMPPTHAFPDAPPANSVYTSEMPPPYPGLYPPTYLHPPGSQYYPQAGPDNQAIYYREQMPPAPGFFPNQGVPPPAYDGQGTAPPSAQQNGTAPPADSKSGFYPPPMYEYMEDPRNPHIVYAEPHHIYQQGAPPPYTPDSGKKEQ